MRKLTIQTHDTRHTMRDAFTLIELLITTSIFSVMILTVYSTFNTGLLSNQRIEASLDTYQTARRILNRMSLDLKNSFSFSSEDTKFTGKNNELSFLTLIGSNFSSVSYRLGDGKLLRIYKRNSESLKEEEMPRPRILAKRIKGIEFAYAYLTEDERVFEWKDEWDQKDKLPLAVKIKLILIEKLPKQKEKEVEFCQIVFLPLAD